MQGLKWKRMRIKSQLRAAGGIKNGRENASVEDKLRLGADCTPLSCNSTEPLWNASVPSEP